MPKTSTTVSICICTYKRPRCLNSLLNTLQNQSATTAIIQIVICDNDPSESAKSTIAKWLQRSKFPITPVFVSQPNISLARNACIGIAQGEWLALIDDDELPCEDWVEQLLTTAENYKSNIVFGPVLPLLPKNIPSWMIEGNFFDRPRHATGTKVGISDARTGNALIRKDILDKAPFSTEFGRTGGEDTFLFQKLFSQGFQAYWSDEAIVTEEVPPERATCKWLIQRSFRTGQTYARTQNPQKNTIALIMGVLHEALKAGILFPISRMRSLRRLRVAAWNSGILTARLGCIYQEYKH